MRRTDGSGPLGINGGASRHFKQPQHQVQQARVAQLPAAVRLEGRVPAGLRKDQPLSARKTLRKSNQDSKPHRVESAVREVRNAHCMRTNHHDQARSAMATAMTAGTHVSPPQTAGSCCRPRACARCAIDRTTAQFESKQSQSEQRPTRQMAHKSRLACSKMRSASSSEISSPTP
jgi:hypothetical protein